MDGIVRKIREQGWESDAQRLLTEKVQQLSVSNVHVSMNRGVLGGICIRAQWPSASFIPGQGWQYGNNINGLSDYSLCGSHLSMTIVCISIAFWALRALHPRAKLFLQR